MLPGEVRRDPCPPSGRGGIARGLLLLGAMAAVLAMTAAAPATAPARTVEIGPAGGRVSSGPVTVIVPRDAFRRSTRITIGRAGAPARSLAPVSTATTRPYRIRVRGTPERAVTLRMRLRTAVRGARRARMTLATRAGAGGAWVLRQGSVSRDGRYVSVRTRHFSIWQARQLTAGGARSRRDVLAAVTAGLAHLAPFPAAEPTCSRPPTGLVLSTEGQPAGDLPAGACLDTEAGEPVLRISNRRRVALRLRVPDGMRVLSASGGTLGEQFWDEVNDLRVPSSGRFRVVPAGGGLTLAGPLPSGPILVVPAEQALLVDAILLGATTLEGGVSAVAGELAAFVDCILNQPSPATPALELARSIAERCGRFMPSPLVAVAGFVLGAERLLAGLVDRGFALVRGDHAAFQVSAAAPSPSPSPSRPAAPTAPPRPDAPAAPVRPTTTADLQYLVGRWTGPIVQVPAAVVDYGADMTLQIRASADGVDGQVRFPELDCGGTLTYLSTEGAGVVLLQERLTFGVSRCVQDCRVRLTPLSQNELRFEELCSTGSSVVGVLRRTVPGDLDGDGYVGCRDVAILRSQFGQSGTALSGDLDRNGRVDIADLGRLLSLSSPPPGEGPCPG